MRNAAWLLAIRAPSESLTKSRSEILSELSRRRLDRWKEHSCNVTLRRWKRKNYRSRRKSRKECAKWFLRSKPAIKSLLNFSKRKRNKSWRWRQKLFSTTFKKFRGMRRDCVRFNWLERKKKRKHSDWERFKRRHSIGRLQRMRWKLNVLSKKPRNRRESRNSLKLLNRKDLRQNLIRPENNNSCLETKYWKRGQRKIEKFS